VRRALRLTRGERRCLRLRSKGIGADERICTSMMLPPAGSRPAASPVSPHPHNVWLARSDLRRRLSDYESGALHAKLQASEAMEPPEGDAPSSSRYQRDASLTTLRRQKVAENRGHAPQRDEPADPGSSRSRSSNGLFSLGRRVRDCTGDLLHVGQALCLTELRDEKWLRIQVTLLGLPGQSRPRCCYANPQ
jgi:hypothetical protein